MGKRLDVRHVIDTQTATASSAAQDIEGAKKVVLVYQRSSHGSGSTAFSATVSVDGTNYVSYNKWIDNVTNTNGQTLTRVASKSLDANGVGFLTMSPEDSFKYIIVTATETTDGTHDAWLSIEY
jgi:hypothetical protein